jgi:hypothetical protein
MIVKNQKFGVAENVQGFRNIQFQAIIGLAYPSLAANQTNKDGK